MHLQLICVRGLPLALGAVLAACSATPQPAPPVQVLSAAPPQQHLCQPEAAQPWLGQTLQPDTAERVRAATGAQLARVIRPQNAITKDLRPYRVNLVLNAQDQLIRVFCG